LNSETMLFSLLQDQIRFNVFLMQEINELISHTKKIEQKTRMSSFEDTTKERILSDNKRIIKELMPEEITTIISSVDKNKLQNSLSSQSEDLQTIKRELSDSLEFILQLQKNDSTKIGSKELYILKEIHIECDLRCGKITLAAGDYEGRFYESHILKIYHDLMKIINFCYVNLSNHKKELDTLNFEISKEQLFYLAELRDCIQKDVMTAKGRIYQKIDESMTHSEYPKKGKKKKIDRLYEKLKPNIIKEDKKSITIDKYIFEKIGGHKDINMVSDHTKKEYKKELEEMLGKDIILKKD